MGAAIRPRDRALRRRRSLAAGYRCLLDDTRRPPRCLTSRIPARGDEVLEAAPDIERLIGVLEDLDRPVDAEIVRDASRLLCDGAGPLYAWAEPRTVRRRVRVLCEAAG